MFKQIAIRNFQSLETVTLELGRITVITGHTDSGKSALIRAMRAIAFNESVLDFATVKDGKEAQGITIALQEDNGQAILWEKSKGSTKYKLLKPGEQPMIFSKMGRSFVPDEIKEALGFRDLQIDKTISYQLQFAEQHDTPFLIIDKGGVFASRVLGRLTGVNVLSYANRHSKADKDARNANLLVAAQKIKSLEAEVATFANVDEVRNHLVSVKQQAELLKARLLRLKALKQLFERWQLLQGSYQTQLSKKRTDVPFDWVEQELRRLWSALGHQGIRAKVAARWVTANEQVRIADRPELLAKWATVEGFDLKPAIDRAGQLRNLLGRVAVALRAKLANDAIVLQKDLAVTEVLTVLVNFEEQFPLCPWAGEFCNTKGVYRCGDLMKVVNGQKQ